MCQSTITSVPMRRKPPLTGRGKRRARASNTLISTVVSSSATPAVATSDVTGDTLPSGRITTAYSATPSAAPDDDGEQRGREQQAAVGDLVAARVWKPIITMSAVNAGTVPSSPCAKFRMRVAL